MIVPDFTYPATALTVLLTGATPVIVDVDPATMLLDLDAARAAISPATKAVMPVVALRQPPGPRRPGRLQGGDRAQRYLLEQRGLRPQVVRDFRLGWAPDAWEGLRRFLGSQGVPEALAIEAGDIGGPGQGRRLL